MRFASLRALSLMLVAGLGVAACAENVSAPPEDIAARAYVNPAPASLTLYTVVRTRDGSGGHSALLINGPQQVLFDPAGSFKMPSVPERSDVLYGFDPRAQEVYIDFHARETWTVHEHSVQVTPEVAALALQLAQQNGAVGPARCAIAVGGILRKLPGFEDVRTGWYPTNLESQFANRPGVTFREIADDDADNNQNVLIRATKELQAEGLI